VKQIPYSDQKTSKLFHEIKSHIESFDTTIEIDLTDTHKDVDKTKPQKFFVKAPISATVKVMNSSLVIEPSAPLHPQDSPHQTFGCRHRNPQNCSSNSMERVCAFVTADTICLKPPARWATQYKNLLMLADTTNHVK